MLRLYCNSLQTPHFFISSWVLLARWPFHRHSRGLAYQILRFELLPSGRSDETMRSRQGGGCRRYFHVSGRKHRIIRSKTRKRLKMKKKVIPSPQRYPNSKMGSTSWCVVALSGDARAQFHRMLDFGDLARSQFRAPPSHGHGS